MPKVFFVTGVNGVGKSSIMPHLKKLLPKSQYQVFDFDQRGVPENADRYWRISETKYWISEGTRLAQSGQSTIVCGFIKPTDLDDYNLAKQGTHEVVLILLDAEPEIIRQRLIGRYTKDGIFDQSQKVIGKPVGEFIDGNVWFSGQLRDDFREHNYPIVDTSTILPEEVAQKVADIVSAFRAES